MKFVFLAATAAAALLASSPAAAVSFGLFNTGVDGLGTPLTNNSAETHYTLIAAPTGQSTAIRTANSAEGFPIGPWLGDNSLSSWIGPVANDLEGAVGSYTYRTTFTLAGLNAATAAITGRWATDDGGLDILLNGVSMGFTSGGFTSFTGFNLNTGFVAGQNTLDFVLNNGGGPTGLRVEMTGNANVAAVPEPATWGLMVLGFGGMGYAMRRRRTAITFNA